MLQDILHNYIHIQNHLIADAFANAMGWVSSWVVWWMMLIVVLLLANLGGLVASACNGMHAFPLGTVIIGFLVLYAMIFGLSWGRRVSSVTKLHLAINYDRIDVCLQTRRVGTAFQPASKALKCILAE